MRRNAQSETYLIPFSEIPRKNNQILAFFKMLIVCTYISVWLYIFFEICPQAHEKYVPRLNDYVDNLSGRQLKTLGLIMDTIPNYIKYTALLG